MDAALPSPEADRQREFRRLLGYSAAAHALLGLVMWIGPPKGAVVPLPPVIAVDLVSAPSALPPAAAPKPAVKPLPKPAPKPEPKPIPKPEPVAKPKPKAPEKVVIPTKPQQAAKPKPAPPAPAEEPDLDDVLKQLRQEAGPAAPAEAPVEAARPEPGGPAGGGAVVTPEVLAWMRRAKMQVTRAWVLAPGFRTEPLETEIRVRLDASGEVLDTDVTRRSGNPWFDESVERAIQKASPLPVPPEAADWVFVFRPGDAL